MSRSQDDRTPRASWQPADSPRRGETLGSRAEARSRASAQHEAGPPAQRTRSQARAEERAAQRAQDGSPRLVPPIGRRGGEDEDEHHARRPRRFSLLLTLAALGLLAWAGMCFVDTGQPTLVALTSLAPLLSVLALPVLAIAVARRQSIVAVLSIGAAIVPWALVTGSAVAGPGPTSATNRQVLRVMTVDGAAGKASAPTIVRATRSFGVDVLVVTGLTSGLAHDLTIAGINSVVSPRWVSIPAGTSVGAGFWSRQPISAAKPVPGSSQPSAITQLISSAGPLTLVVAEEGGPGVVPDNDWRADLQALETASPSGPRILAGDLGGTPWHPAFRGLRSHGWYEAADVLGRGLRPTWPTWGPVPFTPLDQVMVGGGLGVSRANTVTMPGTSHRALLVSVILPTASDGHPAGD